MTDMDSWQVGSDILPQGLIRNFLRSAALGSPRYESLWQFRWFTQAVAESCLQL